MPEAMPRRASLEASLASRIGSPLARGGRATRPDASSTLVRTPGGRWDLGQSRVVRWTAETVSKRGTSAAATTTATVSTSGAACRAPRTAAFTPKAVARPKHRARATSRMVRTLTADLRLGRGSCSVGAVDRQQHQAADAHGDHHRERDDAAAAVGPAHLFLDAVVGTEVAADDAKAVEEGLDVQPGLGEAPAGDDQHHGVDAGCQRGGQEDEEGRYQAQPGTD